MQSFNRRSILKSVVGGSLFAGGASLLGGHFALGQQTKLKIGVMLPKSGTFAQVGDAVLNGFKLASAQANNRLGGRDSEIIFIDAESDPSKASENANRLVNRAKR